VWEVLFLSLKVSGTALLFATLIGIPLGAWLGFARFPGRRLVIALIYTGMGFPPVVIGLLVYLFISRSGPLGFLGWLFNPSAMVLAQTIIAFPLVAGFTMAAVIGVNPGLRQQLLSLGATSWQATLALLREARVGVVVSLVAGFGAIISEVGAVMMVGGNIEGHTRVLTTAVVQLTRMGAFAAAMALGLILLALSFLVNLGMLRLQGRME
jgi:tungstate transport system permease protein